MKRIAIFLLVLNLLIVFCSCTSVGKNLDEKEYIDNVQILSAPYSFASFESFEKHEKSASTKTNSHYYTPSNLPNDYKLAEITKRDDVYITVKYTLSKDYISKDDLDAYEIERLQTLICKYFISSNATHTLEEVFIKNGYKAIEYNDKIYYRWDEHADNNPEKNAIGYEIAFIEGGDLIFMHLPAVDTFENMMKYASVLKSNIN